MGQPPIDRIRNNGPFQYRQDGTIFRNREGRLPDQPYRYYQEYTVDDPSAPDRGERRLVVGRGGEIYYTDDHYITFTPLK